MHVVATAGHVDHGKSTLVLALTNIDPDRFAEEKRRGLTIDLGFAWTTLPSGQGIAFVDVPGHVRFLKNMLAGVGAVDACLFVVAATEGWKPQSEEHLRILELLGISHGVIALTKVGIVDDDHAELARLDVIDHVAGTFLDGAEIVAVDAPTGVGLGGLRLALDRLLTDTPTAADHERPRLWVDRSFAAAGAGTVVTGTLTGGRLATGDEVVVVNEAGEHPVRVRGLQSLGQSHDALGPGNRTAVNLVGVHHHDVARGDAWCAPGNGIARARSTRRCACSTRSATRCRGAARTSRTSAAASIPCGCASSAPTAIAPGEQGLVRLHLPIALPLVPGDRFVLRESGRSETVGGGEVLDVAPALRASKAQPDRSVERVVAERGGSTPPSSSASRASAASPLSGVGLSTPRRWPSRGAPCSDGERRRPARTRRGRARRARSRGARHARCGGRRRAAGGGGRAPAIPLPVTRSWPRSKRRHSCHRARTIRA